MNGNQELIDQVMAIRDALVKLGVDSSKLTTPMDVLSQALGQIDKEDNGKPIDPYQALPMAAGKPVSSEIDRKLIASAMKEHGGNYGKAVASLQRNLMKDDIAAGYTPKAAAARARDRHPVIFA